jgi:hypothetical protein
MRRILKFTVYHCASRFFGQYERMNIDIYETLVRQFSGTLLTENLLHGHTSEINRGEGSGCGAWAEIDLKRLQKVAHPWVADAAQIQHEFHGR